VFAAQTKARRSLDENLNAFYGNSRPHIVVADSFSTSPKVGVRPKLRFRTTVFLNIVEDVSERGFQTQELRLRLVQRQIKIRAFFGNPLLIEAQGI
jgi:hypothetical protein